MKVHVSKGISHDAKVLVTGRQQGFQAGHIQSSYVPGLEVPLLVSPIQDSYERDKVCSHRSHENSCESDISELALQARVVWALGPKRGQDHPGVLPAHTSGACWSRTTDSLSLACQSPRADARSAWAPKVP